MVDPRKKRYLYAMLSGFGAISMSVILFFILYRLQGIGQALNRVGTILAPFIYGGVIAYLLRPMCNTLESFFTDNLPGKTKKLSNMLAVLISLFTGILAVYTLIIMIAPRLYVSFITIWNSLPSRAEQLMKWSMETFGEDERLIQFFNERYESFFTDLEKWFKETIMPRATIIVSGVSTSVWGVLRFVYNLLVGLIVSVYLLYGRKKFAKQSVLIVRSILPDKWADMFLDEMGYVDRMFGGFIDGKIIDSAIVGVLCYIGCSILRIPNALLVSVFVGVTNVIPFFGPVIGAVPATILILMESPLKALWFVLFVLVLQQLDGNIIGPRILGNRTGLSGFWVLFAIILFGGMWGIVGMIVCVPVFAVFYDLVTKMVRRGLRKNGHIEIWEKYRSEYPETPEDLMKGK